MAYRFLLFSLMFFVACSGTVFSEEPENHEMIWSFQPLIVPGPLEMRNQITDPVSLDTFVFSGLEERGLKPASEADRRVLIRRATFDLIGLPPTIAEVESFVNDPSEDAFDQVIERLLASPRYGERWGRHWLDVVRYADSNGLDENVAFGNAWRYRDYVVDSFNQDKPYDLFVKEQIAGDLLQKTGNPAQQKMRVIATGFLSLGPKVLAEVDAKKMEMDIIDEQINTLGQAFLGLTLGCARCHDHKFDPVSMDDYYGLVGIFQSTRTMEHFSKVARWYENSIASEAQNQQKKIHDRQVVEIKESIEKVIGEERLRLNLKTQAEDVENQDAESMFSEIAREKLATLRERLKQQESNVPEQPMALGVAEGTIADSHMYVRGNHLDPGPSVPRHLPVSLSYAGKKEFSSTDSGRMQLAEWLVDQDHPLTSRVMVNRIWRWHFGRGLVRSTDNFGKLGEKPFNQPLLDWLAKTFMDSGWSIKALHRVIMRSRTYRMSSVFDSQSAEKDPQNEYYWRMPVRRLEAEPIRDAMLAVSDQMDWSMGGSLLHVDNRAYLFDHTSKDDTRYRTPRRSIYLPVIRNHLYEVFQLFDFSDASVPNGDRPTTTVAPQALFLINSDFVLQIAERLAQKVLSRSDWNDSDRLRWLYMRAYSRPPTELESERALKFLKRFAQSDGHGMDPVSVRVQSWQAYCQVLLCSHEFIYVK